MLKRFSKAPFLFLSRGFRAASFEAKNRIPFLVVVSACLSPRLLPGPKNRFVVLIDDKAVLDRRDLDDFAHKMDWNIPVKSNKVVVSEVGCARKKNRVPSSFSTKANVDAENTTNTNTTNKASLSLSLSLSLRRRRRRPFCWSRDNRRFEDI